MAGAIVTADAFRLRRGRFYRRINVHGTGLPPVPAPGSYLRAVHVVSGTYANIDHLVYGPTLLYFWGTIPRISPRGLYNLVYSDGGTLTTITNAFRVV